MEKLKTLFDNLGVYYENISDKEIRVVCPFDRHPNARTITTKELLNKDLICLSDEGSILIMENENGELNWIGLV